VAFAFPSFTNQPKIVDLPAPQAGSKTMVLSNPKQFFLD
jgi:hypothetical protein